MTDREGFCRHVRKVLCLHVRTKNAGLTLYCNSKKDSQNWVWNIFKVDDNTINQKSERLDRLHYPFLSSRFLKKQNRIKIFPRDVTTWEHQPFLDYCQVGKTFQARNELNSPSKGIVLARWWISANRVGSSFCAKWVVSVCWDLTGPPWALSGVWIIQKDGMISPNTSLQSPCWECKLERPSVFPCHAKWREQKGNKEHMVSKSWWCQWHLEHKLWNTVYFCIHCRTTRSWTPWLKVKRKRFGFPKLFSTTPMTKMSPFWMPKLLFPSSNG